MLVVLDCVDEGALALVVVVCAVVFVTEIVDCFTVDVADVGPVGADGPVVVVTAPGFVTELGRVVDNMLGVADPGAACFVDDCVPVVTDCGVEAPGAGMYGFGVLVIVVAEGGGVGVPLTGVGVVGVVSMRMPGPRVDVVDVIGVEDEVDAVFVT
jgi:hypothetical protein